MLEVKNLTIAFAQNKEMKYVVDKVSFSMSEGEIVGLVGESGSGKTMLSLAITGLLSAQAMITNGEILLEGEDLLQAEKKEKRKKIGMEVGIVFQEPMTALNPTMKIGRQVEERLRLHTKLKKEQRRELVYKVLKEVELEEPEKIYHKYPHELSGGMKQRAMIASAIIGSPKLLIADEPTTALDVKTQRQILKLLLELNKKRNMGILFISHNLRIVGEICDNVFVMKDGNIIESGKANQIFENPKEDYTKRLIEAIPKRKE